MNGYEVSEMINSVKYCCDGRRKYNVKIEYVVNEKILLVRFVHNHRIVESFKNVSLSNVKQLLYKINKDIKNDNGFEKLIELLFSYR